MKLIIPMAGMGKRMRPHTLTVPKPLIKVAGKPIVQRLVEDIVDVSDETIDEVAFVIGRFGSEVEAKLINIAENLGAKASIYYQDEPLGTAHAIYCAANSINDKTIVAFADTLFKADFKLDSNKDSIIWTHKVGNPESFGVVKKNQEGLITDFVEKPKEFVSDEAIIGIYYFKDGENLRSELKYIIDNEIVVNGEFQLTDVLENMKNKGLKFYTDTVVEWLDCGNKDATVYTNKRVLINLNSKNTNLIDKSLKNINSVVIEPCFIGPFYSIGNNTKVQNSIVQESIIQNNCEISSANIDKSMIGNNSEIQGVKSNFSVGDFTKIK
jgi:glucose-1-phosphate thymidylyltransferase